MKMDGISRIILVLVKTGEWGYTINLCVLVALYEETEGLYFPTRSGYGLLKPQKDFHGNIFIILLPKHEISKKKIDKILSEIKDI